VVGDPQVRARRWDSPADFSYWRREPLAHASGLLAGLAGVRAPRCFARSEDSGGVVLWLEDLGDSSAGWTADHRLALMARRRVRLAARAAGQVAAAGRAGLPTALR
jgi:aminoglycoside/choline kinase family phosphotransferase